MTPDEVKRIAAVVSMADGRCSTCVGSLFELLALELPEVNWAEYRNVDESVLDALHVRHMRSLGYDDE